MVPKPDNLIADEVIIDKDEMVEVEQALTGKSEYASIVFQCEEIRGQTDEQASPTSWNFIAHLAPRPEPPRCCLRILGFEPEPVLIPVAFPELPSNNQTEYFTTVVHRARLFSVMVPKPDNLIADEVIIDKDEMVEVEQGREELLDSGRSCQIILVMVPKPDNQIADEVIIDKDKDEMVEVKQARE
ncbi:unnamed protein product [Mytilus coruscus]|uniref:Uncharacterized protein n=1 Tax=Mytilus coruscus TaxID=42192 RepID=A0A6J8CYY0_MYTCO|nr:unnamed protein product [Mytilus coruscus]